jgi:hypothetical protein
MGGTHAALADDFDTLFVNPAGITTAKDQFSAATINVTLSDIDTILRLLSSNFSDPAIYAEKLNNHFEAGFDISGPLTIGYIKDNFGFAVSNHQFLKVWWDRYDIFVINANVVEELVLYLGRSFPMTNFEQTMTFTLGYMLRPMARLVFAPRNIQLADFRYILQNLQNEPFEMQLGVGIDVGLLLSFSETVYFSAVCRDIITPVYVNRYANFSEFSSGIAPIDSGLEWFQRSYDLSICFRTRNTMVNEVVKDIVFTVDYHGLNNLINNIESDPLMDIGAGFELQLLTAFWLRVGWQKMLPGGGFGVDLGWGKLDVAVFGETFGNQLDYYQTVSFSLAFLFRY